MIVTLPVSHSVNELPGRARAFLARHGLSEASVDRLATDASPRQYARIVGEQKLLMDDHTDPQGFAAYLQISKYLNSLGLSAPRVYQSDPETCLALVEDFGAATYTRCLADGHDEAALYRLAVDALLHLHRAPVSTAPECPAYDLDTHLDELSIFSHWFAPAVNPDLDVAAFDRTFRQLWAEALAPVADRRDTLVLRDFHVDNLMLLEGCTGVARCGLLDFQDGAIGACEYDLVSLLQDARRDLGDGLEQQLLAYYCAHAPVCLGATAAIRQRYYLLGAQRHSRILGVFVRLCQRDAKPHYLRFLPRVLSQFRIALADAGLTEISAFIDKALPDWPEAAAGLGQTLTKPKGSSDD